MVRELGFPQLTNVRSLRLNGLSLPDGFSKAISERAGFILTPYQNQ